MLVMLDLDNTLADRAGAVDAWINEFVADRALPADAAGWIRATDNDGYSTRKSVLAAVLHRFHLADPIDELLTDYQRRVVELTRPTRGATECLEQLRARGWTLAIVTNGSTKQQHAKIDALGFRSLVDAVVVSEDLGIKKPDRRIFEAAAEATGASLIGAWMVGDAAHHDIEGAAHLGMATAWIRRDRAWPADVDPPTIVLDDLTTLDTAIAAAVKETPERRDCGW